MNRIYMDNAATTAVYPEIADAMAALSKSVYGNPSSIHSEGAAAKKILADARDMTAECLGCGSGGIYFTSGGSESDNWAILGTLKLLKNSGKTHVVTTQIEHPAILNTLKNNGIDATYVPVDKKGYVNPRDVDEAVRGDTALVSVMSVNNEIGTVQPVREIAENCKKRGVLFHTDAVQAVGRITLDVGVLDCDMLSLSAHKFHGPKGIGVLYIREGISLPGIISGGGQERKARAGTENFIAAHGMALALKKSLENREEKNAEISALRDILTDCISKIGGAHLIGGEKRLPGTVCVCFDGISGEALTMLLDFEGIAASSGSACDSVSLRPSHVLTALGIPDETARGSLRLSFNEYNTRGEVEYTLAKLKSSVEKLQNASRAG